ILVVCLIDVDSEFPANAHAIGVVKLGHHVAARAAYLVGLPGDHESPCAVHGDRGLVLVVGGGGVDEEFAAYSRAGGVEALAINALGRVIGEILVFAHPDNDKVPGRIHGDGGKVLVVGDVGVDRLGRILSANDAAI